MSPIFMVGISPWLTKECKLSKLNYMMVNNKKSIFGRCFIFVLLSLFTAGSNCVSAEIVKPNQDEVVIVVDKKTNQLTIAQNNDGVITPIKAYHATLGQRIGDKMIEGDLKTPEGIYDFLFRSLPSTGLKPEFGSMAIYVGYPNLIDKLGHQTGFDILVHGTDNPSRLQQKYDSKGCIVLANDQIEDLWKYIKLKNTRLIVTRDIEQINATARREKLKEFFQTWLKAWQEKRLDDYLDAYAYDFIYDKMNRVEYGKYKDKLNKLYESIKVSADNTKYFFHEKYDLVTFDQHYQSTLPGGKQGFNLMGKKNLYVQLRNGTYKIIAEELIR